jgi:hypothetical protein
MGNLEYSVHERELVSKVLGGVCEAEVEEGIVDRSPSFLKMEMQETNQPPTSNSPFKTLSYSKSSHLSCILLDTR